MKNKTLLLLGLLALLCQRLPAQSWQRLAELPAGQTTALHAQGDTLFAGGLNKVYFSYDGGAHWDSTAVLFPDLDFITSVRYARGRLFVATVVDGVFRSDNGGHSWVADNQGLSGLGALHMSCLEIRGDSLYAGTNGAQIFVKKISTNSSWTPYNTGLNWFNISSISNLDGLLLAGAGANGTLAVQAPPAHTWSESTFAQFSGQPNSFLGAIRQGKVLLGAGSQGLYRSEDEGAHWTPYNPGTGILGSARFVAAGQRMYVNLAKPVAKSFIRYSDDQGLSWHPLEPAPDASMGYDLALCAGRLYAARHTGLWRLDLTTPAPEPTPEMPALGQNFPNPFAADTQIPLTLARAEWVELTIWDAGGRLVHRCWSGALPAGTHQIPVDGGAWPAGVYVCRLQTEAGVAARRMTRQ